ncbi:MAG TPA: methyltransferase domain-containing protein [Hyphomicrobiaceae bacterium]|jgi:SAM-dependent methyltransferase|nr:methyltransferase domain-containing protein [Hyphomicrobiaceae bacterium]
MSMHVVLRRLAALGIALIAVLGAGRAQAPEFVPEVGQDGKDVVWVPTAQTLVDRMLDLAKVGPGDYLIDLGSGDGRTVIAAARRGAKARGIEFDPRMVELARRNAERAGVAGKASFVEDDIFASDFSEATVLTLFLLPELNLRLMPTILKMKPGTRVVSNSFSMGSWRPDKTAEVVQDCKTYCRALLWIVPAKVEGDWQMQSASGPGGPRYLLTLKQTHQFFEGILTGGTPAVVPVVGRLDGNGITFTNKREPQSLDVMEFSGEVTGEHMKGSLRTPGAEQLPLRATRKKSP